MTQERKIFEPLTSKNVCTIYELLYSNGLVSFPITPDAGKKVASIVANITDTHFGFEGYPSPEEKAVAYLYFLINDHPFTDGNKRTATLCFLTVCAMNMLEPVFKGFALDQLAVALEKIQGDHQAIIKQVSALLFAPSESPH